MDDYMQALFPIPVPRLATHAGHDVGQRPVEFSSSPVYMAGDDRDGGRVFINSGCWMAGEPFCFRHNIQFCCDDDARTFGVVDRVERR